MYTIFILGVKSFKHGILYNAFDVSKAFGMMCLWVAVFHVDYIFFNKMDNMTVCNERQRKECQSKYIFFSIYLVK